MTKNKVFVKLGLVVMKFLAQILTNSIAIFIASYLVSGFIFEGNIFTLLVAGAVLGLINFFIKPIIKLITAPLIILSLGLFILVINMFLLWVAEFLIPDLNIIGLWSYFWGTVIITAVNIAFSAHHKLHSENSK